MKIIFVCILKLFLISLGSSKSDMPTHVCEFFGASLTILEGVPIYASDVPKRCDVIAIGLYTIVPDVQTFTPILNSDLAAIQKLSEAGFTIYTYVSFGVGNNYTLKYYFDMSNQAAYDALLCPLIQTINELNICGVVLVLYVYDGKMDYATNIPAFVNYLKKKVPHLKVGLIFYLYDDDVYKSISDTSLFDFKITNSVLDFYFLNMRTHDEDDCTPQIACTGTVINSTNSSDVSLETIAKAITQSTMDNSKIIALLPIMSETTQFFDVYQPLSMYCSSTNESFKQTWCVEHSQNLYNMGQFAKSKFPAIGADWLEFDDGDNSCGCQPYPATNILFDGYDGAPYQACQMIV